MKFVFRKTRSHHWVAALFLAFSCVFPLASLEGKEGVIHHDLTVKLTPVKHWIEVKDTITLPEGFSARKAIHFILHKNLDVKAEGEGILVRAVHGAPDPARLGLKGSINLFEAGVPVTEYSITPEGGTWPACPEISISYGGEIYHPLQSDDQEYARSFSQTPGIISEEGTVISGSTYWVPWFGFDLVSYRMEVELPQGRDAVSQGKRVIHESSGGSQRVIWDCPQPMDDIYLIDAAFVEYARTLGKVTAQVYLRSPDTGLAGKYLDATVQYIDMYSRLLGPYPFTKFALVENFWETGYGMPSFTLLGPKIIRFPFILRSSYPHEILHNWWGNSVFVTYEKGNWCEGVTAYLADHLFKEIAGQGQAYRRDTLQRYLNFVKKEKDFPLRQFKSRHDAATEAIGYGKSLMLYHMLRVRMGDERFIECLQAFYKEFIFKRASFEDVESVFSRVSGSDLKGFFKQWVDRTGAPEVRLGGYAYVLDPDKGTYCTQIDLVQTQKEAPFQLIIPLAVHFEADDTAHIYNVAMEDRKSSFSLEGTGKIVKVEVDPEFDVFRRLHREEIPATIGQAFGDDKAVILLPEGEPEELSLAWKSLAAAWQSGQEDKIDVKKESDLSVLPQEASLWIFGKNNRWKPSPELLEQYGISVQENRLVLDGTEHPLEDHCFVMTFTSEKAPDHVLAWVLSEEPRAIPGLGRKMPHYGKYSYLAFEGSEPTNVAKGQWRLASSPMVVRFEEGDGKNLPGRSALTEPAPLVDSEALNKHVTFLADDRLAGRGLGTQGLDEAAAYIERCFQSYGLEAGGEMGTFIQAWMETTGPEKKDLLLKNVIGIIPGRDPELAGQPLVVGAHYDHLGLGWPDVHAGDEGKIHNGADDNASGVAILLELARLMGGKIEPARTIIFAAFTGEECGLLGSSRFIARKEDGTYGKDVFAMINLDSVGRLNGRKLLVFGTGSAKEWPYIIMWAGMTTGFESHSVAKDPGTGDQVSFLEAGIPAIHLFAGIHEDYHRPTDDVEKIDYEGMGAITALAKEIILYLADRKEPLQAITKKDSPVPMHGDKGGSDKVRRASLGTMPDFSYQGEGVRIGSLRPESAAAAAGLVPEDVILSIDGTKVKDLKGLSHILKEHDPGDTVKVAVKRGENELTVDVVLQER